MITVHSYDEPDYDMNITLTPELCKNITQYTKTVGGSKELVAEVRIARRPLRSEDRDKIAEFFLTCLYEADSDNEESIFDRLDEVRCEAIGHISRQRDQEQHKI